MSARRVPQINLRTRKLIGGVLLLLSALSISGCLTVVDTEGSQEQRVDAIATLGDGSELRQTLTSRRSGLKQVELWLRPPSGDSRETGAVRAELWRNPDDPGPIAEAVFNPGQIVAGGDTVSLTFPPQHDSENATYELRLQGIGGETIVLGRFEDVYGDGTAAQDGEYLLADSAFRLAYEYSTASTLEDIGEILARVWLVLPLVAVILLPGWLLIEWSGAGGELDGGGKLGLSIGLSLSTIPLLMAWTSLLGLSWGRWAVLAAALLLSVLAAVRVWTKHRAAKQGQRGVNTAVAASSIASKSLSKLKSGPTIPAGLAVIFFVTLVVRTAMARDLSAPPWVDSVHHALITRLILEGGSFPPSYAPYLLIDASGYHPGFHSVLAAFLWLSNLEVDQGMLVFGQILNALSIFSVYLFTTTLLGSRKGSPLAGMLAALIAGLFTPMPAYYTSWGRYTQLAALVILPAAFALLLRSIKWDDTPADHTFTRLAARRWKVILLAAIAASGLFLTHYRVMAFFGCLLLAYGIVAAIRWLIRRGEAAEHQYSAVLQSALLLGFLSLSVLLLTAPWLLPTMQELLLPRLIAWIPPTAQRFSGVTWPYMTTAWGTPAMALAGLGLGLGILQRRAFPWVLVLWVGLLFFIANLGMFGLPGSGFVNSISVTITLFLPVSLAAGYLLSQAALALEHRIPSSSKGAYRWLLAGAGMVVALLAARQQITLLNPVTFLFRPADRAGISWAAENIPPGETVLVNPFAWGYGQYAGGDGGYWISALGDHPTFPPPVLYGLSNSAEYIDNTNTTSKRIIDAAGDPQALHGMLQEQGIRYVYIGGRGGVLSPRALRESPLFAPRYARDGVFVFEVLP